MQSSNLDSPAPSEPWMTEMLLSKVESVLSPEHGMSRRDIHRAVDCYSPSTVKHLLRELDRRQIAGASGVLAIEDTHLARRIAGVPGHVEDLIRRYLDAIPLEMGEGGPLFVNNRGRRLTTRSVQMSFRRRGAELGLPVTAAPICLRHGVGQRLADAGQPPAAVARALGVSVAAAGRYFE